MNTPDRNSLYVLICSLTGAAFSILAVWDFTAAATLPLAWSLKALTPGPVGSRDP